MKKLLIVLVGIAAVAVVSCKRDRNELPQAPSISTQATQKEFNCKVIELPLTKRRPDNPGGGHGNGGNSGNGGGGNGGGGGTQAVNVIMIDYDGGVLPPSSWSSTEIVYSPSGLSLEANKLIVARIAADLDSLNVIVTDRQSLYDSTPAANRQILILTTNNFFSPDVAGVAFFNSFGTEEVAWVFTETLGYNVDYIYQVSPHELGHTLGLYHQSEWHPTCYLINTYIPGWTMGRSYGLPVAKWKRNGATDRACNYYQTDMDVMMARLGRKYAAVGKIHNVELRHQSTYSTIASKY